MSEQQADYDTGDTQPTPGPLRTKGLDVVRDDPLRPDEYWVIASFSEVAPQFPHVEGDEPENLGMGPETAKKNAELYAAAGTVASELPEGYDPVAVLKELPHMLSALKMLVDEVPPPDGSGASHRRVVALSCRIKEILNAARKDTTRTDE